MVQSDNRQWSTKRINRSADTLFWLCFLAYTFSYIGRQNFSACLPAMIADGTLTKPFGGYISTAYMIVYGAGQLINGIMGSKISPQKMIGCGLCGAGCMNICMSFCSSPILMAVIWSFNGLFQSMLWAPVIRAFTDQLPEEKRYKAGVNIAVSCPAGTVCAYLIPALFLKIANWHTVFLVCGGCVLLAFFVWSFGNLKLKDYLYIMEKRISDRNRLQEESVPSSDSISDRKKVNLFTVMIPSGLLLVTLCLICNGSLRDAVTTWAPTFFTEQFDMKPEKSAILSVIIPIVSVSGAYVSTWLDRRFLHNELWTSGVMFITSAISILGIRLFSSTAPTLCAICLAVCISAMWGANTMFLTMLPYHFSKLGLSAPITGFLNCSIYLASAASTSLYGLASEKAGWNALVYLWLGISLVGVVFCLLFGIVWRKKAKRLDEGTLL